MTFRLTTFRLTPLAKASTWLAGAAFFAAAGCGATSALAGDDGQAPIWVGVGSIFGLASDGSSKDPIDYRERGKIVLPSKMDLPPPGVPAVRSAGAWPVDPDVHSRKQEQEKERAVAPRTGYVPVKAKFSQGFDPDSVVTVRATAGMGPGDDCPDGVCESSPMEKLNPLGWFGGEKKTLGPEPSRAWLTDPPKGYRAPYSASTTAEAEVKVKKLRDPHFTRPAWGPDSANTSN
jgi:hypothetical protein